MSMKWLVYGFEIEIDLAFCVFAALGAVCHTTRASEYYLRILSRFLKLK